MIRTLLLATVLLFPLSEIALAVVKRSRRDTAEGRDEGSMALLWGSIALAVGLAVAATRVPGTHIPVRLSVLRPAALALLLAGLTVRWTAILTLGRFFTVNVAVHRDHRVVASGPYRYVRHPSYSGLLAAFAGLGLAFANWLSVAVILLLVGAAVMIRVRKEERALLQRLGPDYAAYCARTKRFIPGVL